MADTDEYRGRIVAVSSMIRSDNTSPDETDPAVLSKYREFSKSEFGVDDEAASQLVFESLVYLKLQSADLDPLSDGERFGVGFS